MGKTGLDFFEIFSFENYYNQNITRYFKAVGLEGDYYELKGYPKGWIDKRLRGIAVRQELTDEWKNRSVNTEKIELAIF